MPDSKSNRDRTVPIAEALRLEGEDTTGSEDVGPATTIPYWRGEAARWRRHAQHFTDLARGVADEIQGTVAPALRPPSYVDLRSNRYWWFTHMAAVYAGWASRAEERLAHLTGRRRLGS